MGTSFARASSHAAGKSTVRLGAPLANGTFSFRHAHAYICEFERAGSLFARPASNDAIDWCTDEAGMKISVEPHQTATARLHSCVRTKVRMSLRSCSTMSALLAPVLT